MKSTAIGAAAVALGIKITETPGPQAEVENYPQTGWLWSKTTTPLISGHDGPLALAQEIASQNKFLQPVIKGLSETVVDRDLRLGRILAGDMFARAVNLGRDAVEQKFGGKADTGAVLDVAFISLLRLFNGEVRNQEILNFGLQFGANPQAKFLETFQAVLPTVYPLTMEQWQHIGGLESNYQLEGVGTDRWKEFVYLACFYWIYARSINQSKAEQFPNGLRYYLTTGASPEAKLQKLDAVIGLAIKTQETFEGAWNFLTTNDASVFNRATFLGPDYKSDLAAYHLASSVVTALIQNPVWETVHAQESLLDSPFVNAVQ